LTYTGTLLWQIDIWGRQRIDSDDTIAVEDGVLAIRIEKKVLKFIRGKCVGSILFCTSKRFAIKR
jgi:hypothetical protein